MKKDENLKKITGIILKNTECEFLDYCTKSGVQCLHTGMKTKADYHCGYCKAFRQIEYTQNRKLGEKH